MAVKLPEQINGYIPLPVKVTGEKVTGGASSSTYHIIYVKKHQSKDSSDSADRSVFLVNLPTDTSSKALRDLCQQLGNVIMEDFQSTGGNNGILELVDKTACKAFISKARQAVKSQTIAWNNSKSLTGSLRYQTINRNNYKDVEELEENVNFHMEAFARAEEARARQVETLSQEVDEDGFIKVINSKRKSLNGLATASAPADSSAPRKKKRSKEKADFYRFQIRDQKKQEMNQLLRRFHQDKLKVAQLKEQRRFKPY